MIWLKRNRAGSSQGIVQINGYTDEEIARPLISVANSKSEIIPGHIHLDKITEAVKAGIRMAGGTGRTVPSEYVTA